MAFKSQFECDHACCKSVLKLDIDMQLNSFRDSLHKAIQLGWRFTWRKDNCLALGEVFCPDHAGTADK